MKGLTDGICEDDSQLVIIKISAQGKNRKLTPISLGIMNFKREPKKYGTLLYH